MPLKKTHSGDPAPNVSFSLLAGLFLASLPVLMLEVSLTRIFSVFLGYHFVFIAVSTAILGLGLGAMLFYKFGTKASVEKYPFKVLGFLALAFSLSILLSLLALLNLSSPDNWFIYILLTLPPFFLVGIFLALAYHQFAPQSNVLYFADLTGAAFGSLGVVLLLQALGGINTAGVASLFPAIGGIILLKKERRTYFLLSLAIFFTVVSFAGLNLRYGFLRMNLSVAGEPHKTLLKIIREGKGRIIYTEWNAFSRVDVVETTDPGVMKIFIDGGAPSDMLKFEGDFSKIERRLKSDIGFFPYYFTQPQNTLIIGPGGGKDVLFALLGKSEHITAVEINPSVVRVVEKFSHHNGGIYYYENVHWVLDEGRSFINRTQDQYDMIYLSQVYTSAAEITGHSLMENYIYTTEAIRGYLSHLNQEGYLVFLLHDITDLTRLFNTLMTVLQKEGKSFQEAGRHIFIINNQPPSPLSYQVHTPLLVFRNTPFSEEECQQMVKVALALNFTPFFSPYLHLHKGAIFGLLSQGRLWMEKLQFQSNLNFTPVSDNSPFFFNYTRGVPASLGKLLVIFLILVCLLFIFYLTTPRKLKRLNPGRRSMATFLFYFFLLGLGFMLVEISLIQRFLLFLGYPALSLSTILFSLLLGGGAGSLLYSRIEEDKLGFYLKVALGINFLLITLYLLLLPMVFQVFISQQVMVRSLIAMALLIPMGFFLGIPFPSGLRMLKKAFPSEIPWMWGINGVSSTLGSILSVTLAILYGFFQALLLGGVSYLLAFCLVWWMKRRVYNETK